MILNSAHWTTRVCATLLTLAFASTAAAQVVNPPRRSNATIDTLRYWNQVAIDASGVDHIPGVPGGRQGAEQLGPGRASRAMAIVHIAMFDAVNSISGGYRSYTGIARETRPASLDAAIATAARDTLVQLFREQASQIDILYNAELARIPPSQEQTKNLGMAIGNRAASRILGMRTNDGSQIPEPRLGVDWFTSNLPGRWRQDPISRLPIALGAQWGRLRPFVMTSASQFRTPPPPALNSDAYTAAFNEVKRLGGDVVHTPTERSQDQTNIGIYWAYDGTPSLCAPPRLYNQITTEISKNETSVIRLARLYALVNTAMADSGIAAWDSKFFYDYWRPVTGVRESDAGTGPTGAGDGNPATIGDLGFWPLGAPASNLNGAVNFTPPFPAYPSGHATFGGTLFQTLRNFYGRDNIAFTFVSDELNGQTRDTNGQVRPLLPRSFASLTQAEEENGQSRIYLGIHWAFDKTAGIAQGRQVANLVFTNAFQRVN